MSAHCPNNDVLAYLALDPIRSRQGANASDPRSSWILLVVLYALTKRGMVEEEKQKWRREGNVARRKACANTRPGVQALATLVGGRTRYCCADASVGVGVATNCC